jgi:hypothetical protein
VQVFVWQATIQVRLSCCYPPFPPSRQHEFFELPGGGAVLHRAFASGQVHSPLFQQSGLPSVQNLRPAWLHFPHPPGHSLMPSCAGSVVRIKSPRCRLEAAESTTERWGQAHLSDQLLLRLASSALIYPGTHVDA